MKMTGKYTFISINGVYPLPSINGIQLTLFRCIHFFYNLLIWKILGNLRKMNMCTQSTHKWDLIVSGNHQKHGHIKKITKNSEID